MEGGDGEDGDGDGLEEANTERDNEQVTTVSTSDSVPLGTSRKWCGTRLTGGPPEGQRSIFSLQLLPITG